MKLMGVPGSPEPPELVPPEPPLAPAPPVPDDEPPVADDPPEPDPPPVPAAEAPPVLDFPPVPALPAPPDPQPETSKQPAKPAKIEAKLSLFFMPSFVSFLRMATLNLACPPCTQCRPG